MKAAGIVSHGGFEFGATPTTTANVDELFASKDIYWIETAHFELDSRSTRRRSAPTSPKRIRAELTELQVFFPRSTPRPACSIRSCAPTSTLRVERPGSASSS